MTGGETSPPRPGRAAAVALALVLLGVAAGHLGRLPSTLEDIDSVNFALGVRDFDPSRHRPHPPGYPIYVALGKAAAAATRLAWPDGRPDRVEARALASLSFLGGVALVWLAAAVASALAPAAAFNGRAPVLTTRAVLTALLLAACPLTWYLTGRPMSDVPGLAAALVAVWCLALAWWRQHPAPDGDRRLDPTRMASSGRMVVVGALAAGVAVGFRTQTLWVTTPLLLLVLADRAGRGLLGALLGSAIAFTVGVVAWGVPLVVASGGVQAYLAALGSQAGEDFAGVEMLYLTPTPRLAGLALLRTFVWPWDSVPLAGVVLTLAALGALALLVWERRTALAVAAVTVPYLLFHLAFQDTAFSRYALPVMLPVVFLAAVALDSLGRVGIVAGLALSAWSLSLALPQWQGYVGRGSPTARLLDVLADEAASAAPLTLALHQSLQRPLEAETRPVGAQLPSPPRREWLELVRHWRSGAEGPVHFLADPRRTDLALVDPQVRQDVARFEWNVPSLSMFGGMRPADVALVRMGLPGWFAAEGWSLTPETAGMARLMERGPHLGPISAFVRRRPEPVLLLLGGRNLGSASDPPVRFTAALDGRDLASWEVAPNPGFFVQTLALPAGALRGDGRWAELTVRSVAVSGTARVATAIEQFDVQSPGTVMWAYGDGFHEPELDTNGRGWRWMSDRAEIQVPQSGGDVTLVLRGESPLRYFAQPSTLEIASGGASLGRLELSGDFTMEVGVLESRLAASGGQLVLTTSQTYAPAERGASADRRRLGLRLFEVHIAPGLPIRRTEPISGKNTSDLR